MVKIHQHVKFQAISSMRSPANARKPLRTDGRADWRTDGRTCRKTVTVGRVDQRTHVQVKRGYFRLRTDGRMDGRMDGQPENIMPLAPKGGGIKRCHRLTDWRRDWTIHRAAWLQLNMCEIHFIFFAMIHTKFWIIMIRQWKKKSLLTVFKIIWVKFWTDQRYKVANIKDLMHGKNAGHIAR